MVLFSEGQDLEINSGINYQLINSLGVTLAQFMNKMEEYIN